MPHAKNVVYIARPQLDVGGGVESADSRICCSMWSINISATKLDIGQPMGYSIREFVFLPFEHTNILLSRQILINDENSLIISGWIFFFCSKLVMMWIDWVTGILENMFDTSNDTR